MATRLPVVAHLPAPRPLPTFALHKRTNSDTVGVRLALRAIQVSVPAFVLLPCGCQPTHRFVAKDEDSTWRALRRRGDPGSMSRTRCHAQPESGGSFGGPHRTLRQSRTRARPSPRGWTVGALYQDRCSVGGSSGKYELSVFYFTVQKSA